MFTKENLFNQLKNLRVPTDKPVIVHTSLRAIGKIDGGAETLLDVLIECFAKNGLLIVPTHTWANFDQKKNIVLDLTDNKTCIGTFPDVAANDLRGVRTENPTHSVVVFGEENRVIKYISEENAAITPTSPEGVYGKLFSEDGYVLLVGVGQEKNTAIHCVEEMLSLPYRLSDKPVDMAVKYKDGTVKNKKFHYMRSDVIYDVSLFFPKYEPAFYFHQAVEYGNLGNAVVQVCSARKIKEVMELIYKRSGGKEILSDDKSLDEKWYR